MGQTGSLRGQVVVLTGASRGIGEATALALAEAGADLVLGARNNEQLNQVAAACRDCQVNVVAVPCDITRQEDVDRLVQTALDTYGRIDVLINNAGVGYYEPFLELTEEQWDHMFEVNVKGVFRVLKAVVPHMVERGAGHIITVSSIRGFQPAELTTGYGATKFALQGLHQSLAKELAPHNVRVALICPGGVRTYFRGTTPDEKDPRWLESEDIARAIVFMASTRSGAVISQLTVEPASIR